MSGSTSKLDLRPFQGRVFKTVMEGKNVILQAPTGAGKTRAALAPFVEHLANHIGDPYTYHTHMPLTCRYAVPLRVLATQFSHEFAHVGKAIDAHWSTQVEQTYQRFDQRLVQIQTGEQPDDRQFESALTFCTIDQLLASFLAIPYGMGPRRANLNVGAVVGSYLVLDEFHLYPLRDERSAFGARTTALHMLQMLNGKGKRLSPFVLMTATFSSHLLDELASMLDATIVQVQTKPDMPGKPSELEQLNAGRQRNVTVQRAPMSAEAILDQHDGCSLVVCNTVLRAQQMLLNLQAHTAHRKSAPELMLIHSRFTDEDRKKKQERLEATIGKQAWDGKGYLGPDIIIVATQVVEVGLDVSVRTLHSEVAPANSVIQRAGRCARFAGQHGHVYLYPLRDGEHYAPYTREHSAATLNAFAQFQGQHVGFTEEQQVIDAVHGDEDRALLKAFHQNTDLARTKIFTGLGLHDRSIATDLIRNVQQATVLVHPDPASAITERPWEWQTFAIRPYSLVARWQDLQAAAAEIRVLGDDRSVAWEALPNEADSEQGERVPTRYHWEPLPTSARIPVALIIALSPDVATYSEELGFRLNDGRLALPWPTEPFISQHAPQRRTTKSFEPYEQETYAEHIRGLLNAYRDSGLRDDLRYVASRLEVATGLPQGSVDRAVRVAIACHDIGKLSEGWQGWAHAWQQKLFQELKDEHHRPRKAPFAHTEYNWKEHREFERGFKPARPHHACEGAWFAARLIFTVTGDKQMSRAVMAAIARHHSSLSKEYQPMRLESGAAIHIAEMLDEASGAESWPFDITTLPHAIATAGEFNEKWITIPRKEIELETWLYFVIVRALRLADNRSFAFK